MSVGFSVFMWVGIAATIALLPFFVPAVEHMIDDWPEGRRSDDRRSIPMTDSYGAEDKTEQPTSRRLEKARAEGSVVRAHGVAAGTILLTGAVALSLGGAKLVELLELALRRGLSFEPDAVHEPARLLIAVSRVVTPGLDIVAPFLILMGVVGFVADIIDGWMDLLD